MWRATAAASLARHPSAARRGRRREQQWQRKTPRPRKTRLCHGQDRQHRLACWNFAIARASTRNPTSSQNRIQWTRTQYFRRVYGDGMSNVLPLARFVRLPTRSPFLGQSCVHRARRRLFRDQVVRHGTVYGGSMTHRLPIPSFRRFSPPRRAIQPVSLSPRRS